MLWLLNLLLNSKFNYRMFDVLADFRNLLVVISATPWSFRISTSGIKPFHATCYFCTPWKYQKTFAFLMFSGGIEKRPVARNGLLEMKTFEFTPSHLNYRKNNFKKKKIAFFFHFKKMLQLSINFLFFLQSF